MTENVLGWAAAYAPGCAATLFGVEQSRTLKNTLDIMRTLDAMLDDPQMKPLRRTIST